MLQFHSLNDIYGDITATEEQQGQQEQEATVHENEQLAIEGLKKQFNLKNAYEFQDLVAAL